MNEIKNSLSNDFEYFRRWRVETTDNTILNDLEYVEKHYPDRSKWFKQYHCRKISNDEFAERLLYCKEHRLVYLGAKGRRPFKGICAFLDISNPLIVTLCYRSPIGFPCKYVAQHTDELNERITKILEKQSQEGAYESKN